MTAPRSRSAGAVAAQELPLAAERTVHRLPGQRRRPGGARLRRPRPHRLGRRPRPGRRAPARWPTCCCCCSAACWPTGCRARWCCAARRSRRPSPRPWSPRWCSPHTATIPLLMLLSVRERRGGGHVLPGGRGADPADRARHPAPPGERRPADRHQHGDDRRRRRRAASWSPRSGPGWGIAADATSFALAATCYSRIRVPDLSAVTDAPPSTLTQLREGWSEFVSRTWVWVIVVTAMAHQRRVHRRDRRARPSGRRRQHRTSQLGCRAGRVRPPGCWSAAWSRCAGSRGAPCGSACPAHPGRRPAAARPGLPADAARARAVRCS